MSRETTKLSSIVLFSKSVRITLETSNCASLVLKARHQSENKNDNNKAISQMLVATVYITNLVCVSCYPL